MPRLIPTTTSDSITLPELVDALESGPFDPDDEDNFASFGLALKKLANNRRFLGDLVIGHEGLGPVHDAGTDTQHGEGSAYAEQGILEPDSGNAGVVAQIDGEVRHQEDQGSNNRDAK